MGGFGLLVELHREGSAPAAGLFSRDGKLMMMMMITTKRTKTDTVKTKTTTTKTTTRNKPYTKWLILFWGVCCFFVKWMVVVLARGGSVTKRASPV